MITRQDIIEQFHYIETQQLTHSEEYLEEIDNVTHLDDLIDVVALWIRECKGNKGKAMRYILQTLDTI